MEIKGKVMQVLPQQSGVSQRGNQWVRQDYVMETYDRFPRKIHFGFLNDAVNQYPLQVGDDINLSFDLESRSYVGRDGVERWSTDIRAWKAEKIDPSQIQAPAYGAPAPGFGAPAQPFASQPQYAQPAPAVGQFPAAAPAAPAAPAADPMAASASLNPSEDLPF